MSLKEKLVGPTDDEVFNNLKDLKNFSSDRLLIKSCEIGLIKGVELALERGANVDFHNKLSIRISSLHGYTEIVKLFLEKGADVHAEDDYALRWSSRNGHTETVELLKTYMK